jgi:hypothetical protein
MSETIALPVRQVEARITRGHLVGFFDKFYALRYPSLYHQNAPNRWGKDWRRDAPGAAMIFPPVDTPIATLAAEIRPDFLHIAGRMGSAAVAAASNPSALKAFARHRLPADDRLEWLGEDGAVCKLGELLPADETVEAMFDQWHDRGLSRCQPLEQFIGRSLTRNRADLYQWRILHHDLPEVPEEI